MPTNPKRPTTAATRRLIRGLTLDDAGKVRAQAALALARKVDDGAADTALPVMVRELKALVDELIGDTSGSAGRALIDSIFGRRTS